MLSEYKLQLPGVVFSGMNSIEKIVQVIESEKALRIAVFTDKGIIGAGLLSGVEALLKNLESSYQIFDEIPPEPTYMQVQELVDGCSAFDADLILALGGGSVMDTAKLASLLINSEHKVKDLLDNPLLAKKSIKTLMIPTTAGTGSEATPNAIVAVPEKELKVGIVNGSMIPDYVILDAQMIKNLPRSIAAATGVDALAHAIECYTSKKSNPFSDFFAMEALDLIFNNIEDACNNKDAYEAKTSMLLASFYAGVAIACSGTTAVHALSYPLGGKYHIAHGVSNAILLAPVMRFNMDACEERLAKVFDKCLSGSEDTTECKAAAVIEKLEEIVRNLNIPTSLREFGVNKDDLEVLVAAGMGVTRLLNNNMKEVTAEDARSIYLQVLN